jgi:hypothetical protein
VTTTTADKPEAPTLEQLKQATRAVGLELESARAVLRRRQERLGEVALDGRLLSAERGAVDEARQLVNAARDHVAELEQQHAAAVQRIRQREAADRADETAMLLGSATACLIERRSYSAALDRALAEVERLLGLWLECSERARDLRLRAGAHGGREPRKVAEAIIGHQLGYARTRTESLQSFVEFSAQSGDPAEATEEVS